MGVGKDQTGSKGRAEWLPSGGVGLPRMLAAMELATQSICLEMYIFQPDGPGEEFRQTLVSAAERGVKVRVLLDALGSSRVGEEYWRTLIRAGGEVRWFHRMRSFTAMVRDHRKILVCDGRTAFVIGFNVGSVYEGDGVELGWRDAGVLLEGASARRLEQLFDEQFYLANRRQSAAVLVLRRDEHAISEEEDQIRILPVCPGRGPSCLTQSLGEDLARTSRDRGAVTLVSPYLVPTAPLRRMFRRAARAGARLQLVVPQQNDVRISQLASRKLYAGFLRAGIEIREYEPQILHAKIFLFPHAVYVGSSNLDPRSLHLNFELMIRLTGPEVLEQARADVADLVARSRVVDRMSWSRSRSWWMRLREQWAFWVLYRIDPWLTGRAAGR